MIIKILHKLKKKNLKFKILQFIIILKKLINFKEVRFKKYLEETGISEAF